MSEIFQIAPLNPIRFVDVNENINWPSQYNTKPFDVEFYYQSIFDFQTKACFFQKYQTNDSTKIQIWSDYGVDSVTLYNNDTGLAYSIPVVDTGLTFPDFTFSVFEFDLNFSAYGLGRCYIDILYTNVTEFTFRSEPIWIKELWENTLLYQYKNDENAFSIIFDTGIEFNMRIEGILDNFVPRSERVVYNDQIRNTTLLYGVPYREFRLNAGTERGIPDWVADKLTRILDCNEIKIDGEYYVVSDGAEVELNRNEDYPLVGYRITLNQVNNRFNQRLKPGVDDNGDEIQMILKSVNRTDLAGDQSYAGIIKKYTVLHGLAIIKYSGGDITLLVGTSPGGNEISGPDGFIIDEANSFTEINWVFDNIQTVYLSGLAGSQVDINFYYYDPLDITTGGGGGGSPATFVKGTVYMYQEINPGDFSIHWDIGTGLGMVGTAYEGCALMDGNNGTYDMRGRSPMMFGDYTDASGAYSYARGNDIGAAKHKLVRNELPNFKLKYTGIPTGDNRFDNLGGGSLFTANQTLLETEALGSDFYHENRSPARVLTFFLRIAD